MCLKQMNAMTLRPLPAFPYEYAMWEYGRIIPKTANIALGESLHNYTKINPDFYKKFLLFRLHKTIQKCYNRQNIGRGRKPKRKPRRKNSGG